jgi:hypothetical protein
MNTSQFCHYSMGMMNRSHCGNERERVCVCVCNVVSTNVTELCG